MELCLSPDLKDLHHSINVFREESKEGNIPKPGFSMHASTSTFPCASFPPHPFSTHRLPPKTSFPKTFNIACWTVLLGEYTQLLSADDLALGLAGSTLIENLI